MASDRRAETRRRGALRGLVTFEKRRRERIHGELRGALTTSSDKLLTTAVKMNTRYAAAYAWLGEVRTILGNTEAIGLVRRAIQLEPLEPAHRLRAALVLLRVGKPSEARADAEAALTLADSESERQEAERVLEAVRKAEAAMRGRSSGGDAAR